METKAALDAVDKASQMSDRWLFLAAIAFILIGGVTIVRYLVNQLESQRASHTTLMEKTVLALYDATQVMKDVRELLQNGKAHFIIIFALLALALSGCSTTLYSRTGQPRFRTYANITKLHYVDTREGVTIDADRIDHSTPTRAAGSVIGTTGAAVTGAVTAFLTHGAIH